MSKKPEKTFALIFEKPDRNDIDWDDFITLLIYLGASIRQQGGSAHGIKLRNEYAVFHKPHPGHTLYQADLKRIRRFFTNAAIKKVEK
ncbi:MAG: type II toxin-antitoxin system HicA family toxin [Anaerolineae bacterium]|nr:type II toxin-antitoxin system HicA family toxin [Anaerolineae bacterium]